MSLSFRQQQFVLELLADPKRNGTQAAIHAGYSPKAARVSASKLLHNPEVKQAIEDQLATHFIKLEVDAEMVISGIVETIQRARASGEGAWQSATILRGYELLGKYLGLFTDKVELGLDERIMQQLNLGRARAAGSLPAADDREEQAANETTPAEKSKPN